MLQKTKAVLFDLDGTLVDSMWMWKDIDIEYLGRHGWELPKELQKDIEGMSLTETATYFKNRFQLKESLEQIKSEWMDMAREKYCKEVFSQTWREGISRTSKGKWNPHRNCQF